VENKPPNPAVSRQSLSSQPPSEAQIDRQARWWPAGRHHQCGQRFAHLRLL